MVSYELHFFPLILYLVGIALGSALFRPHIVMLLLAFVDKWCLNHGVCAANVVSLICVTFFMAAFVCST
jgi:hypothetical protein